MPAACDRPEPLLDLHISPMSCQRIPCGSLSSRRHIPQPDSVLAAHVSSPRSSASVHRYIMPVAVRVSNASPANCRWPLLLYGGLGPD